MATTSATETAYNVTLLVKDAMDPLTGTVQSVIMKLLLFTQAIELRTTI